MHEYTWTVFLWEPHEINQNQNLVKEHKNLKQNDC